MQADFDHRHRGGLGQRASELIGEGRSVRARCWGTPRRESGTHGAKSRVDQQTGGESNGEPGGDAEHHYFSAAAVGGCCESADNEQPVAESHAVSSLLPNPPPTSTMKPRHWS